MASSPLVETATLASWMGMTFTPEDEERAGTVIQMVSGYAAAEAQKTDWSLVNVPADVALIVLTISVRFWVNPDGKTSVTHDDVTRRWESGEMFDESQLSTLRKYRASGSSGLGTVRFTTPSAQVGSRPVEYPVVGGEPVILYDGLGY